MDGLVWFDVMVVCLSVGVTLLLGNRTEEDFREKNRQTDRQTTRCMHAGLDGHGSCSQGTEPLDLGWWVCAPGGFFSTLQYVQYNTMPTGME